MNNPNATHGQVMRTPVESEQYDDRPLYFIVKNHTAKSLNELIFLPQPE